MTIHSLVALYGPRDPGPEVILAPDSQRTDISFIEGEHRLSYGLGKAISTLRGWGISPTPAALDLSILAGLVTAADTRISRKTESQDSWTREIDLYVPVHNIDIWNSSKELIEKLLKFLSGDIWRLYFRLVPFTHPSLEDIQIGLDINQYDSVSLFSGGLDSFVGALDILSEGKKSIFVSHYADQSTSKQGQCFDIISENFQLSENSHLRVHLSFDKNDVPGLSSENTLRARSFLFFSLAVVVASGLPNCQKIYVPENGLISLNVPLDPLRVGAWSTRTTHPFYMALWDSLLQKLEINIRLENPYRFKTKGEMLLECKAPQVLRSHVNKTISCSSVSKARFHGLTPGQCGYCVPCIIRRASIKKALGGDSTTYVMLPDLRSHTLNSNKAEGENIRSFQIMIDRLTTNRELAKILVYKTGPLNLYSEEDITSYAEVFAKGIEEVSEFLEGVEVKPL
ncbi:MAG: hypothetical protein QE263_00620 [Vampirovibrionales bacterium]|nr:hypothetical protein [Vampirovibrionales bacterium]